MNKVKRTTFKDRICAAFSAFKRGKVTVNALQVGIEFKHCRDCDRGDCEVCYFKRELTTILEQPSCNDCLHNSNCSCGCCPPPGGQVRINCPLWKPINGGIKK